MHAKFPPSAAPQWAYCSGSVLANLAAPSRDTQATREGEAAHWVVAECLTVWRDGGTAFASEWVGRTAPNGVVVDEAMADAAQVMVSDVLDVCNQYGGLSRLLIEHRVCMPAVHPTDNWGTLDIALDLRDVCGRLYEWDFKYGHGEVLAAGNFQLVDYAEGLRTEFGMTWEEAATYDLHLRIVQPRCYTKNGAVDEWVVNWRDLLGYVQRLEAQAKEAETNPQMVAGLHCRYCPARGEHCKAARQSTYRLIDYAKMPYEIETMGDADLAFERALMQEGETLVKARLDAIDDELYHRITKGATDTGLTLEAGRGRSKWSVPTAQAIAFGAQFGVDISRQGVDTPTQAVAKVPAEVRQYFKQAITAVTSRSSTGLKLVPAEGSRTARAFKRSK